MALNTSGMRPLKIEWTNQMRLLTLDSESTHINDTGNKNRLYLLKYPISDFSDDFIQPWLVKF